MAYRPITVIQMLGAFLTALKFFSVLAFKYHFWLANLSGTTGSLSLVVKLSVIIFHFWPLFVG